MSILLILVVIKLETCGSQTTRSLLPLKREKSEININLFEETPQTLELIFISDLETLLILLGSHAHRP